MAIACGASTPAGVTDVYVARVSEDKWVLEGCPDDGPAIAVDAKNRIHIVWPTLITEAGEQTIALFYATSADGRRFTPRQRIPTEGMPHHPQIAIGDDAHWRSRGTKALTASGGRRWRARPPTPPRARR